MQKSLCVIGISLFLIYYGSVLDARNASAKNPSSSTEQSAAVWSATKQCSTDLSFLQPKMEKALQFIKSASFRNTMLASLQASIPEAIAQADGLARQITFLKHEVVRQERDRAHAEKVAREGLADPSEPLKPCRRGKEGSYCHAMDQYLVSIAANLANQAFLEALQCYQREGVR
ncbi:MAG: hypothetical protein VST67_04155 [Nitrospirota bacterium]|nr:hypothetical protein [Nitrospirota bacterium]